MILDYYEGIEDVFECNSNKDDNCSIVESEEMNFELNKDGETIWSEKPICSTFAKTPAVDIVSRLPGPKGRAVGVTDEQDLFLLFVSEEIISDISSSY